MSTSRILNNNTFIAAGLVLVIIMLVFGNTAWSQDSQLQNSLPEGSVTVAQLKTFPSATTIKPLPVIAPKHAMIIVVEENQAVLSTTWVGLSSVLHLSPLDLLPANVRNSLQTVSTTVDPLMRVLNNIGYTNLNAYATLHLMTSVGAMYSAFITAANVASYGAATPIANAYASLSVPVGTPKDPYKAFLDYVGEAGLANSLYQMALPYYDHVEVLTDSAATFASFSTRLKQLHAGGYIIDVFLDLHGCGTPRTNNNLNCGNSGIVFANNQLVTANEIQSINLGQKLNLNAVYMVSCWGSNFNNAWLNLGAKSVNGANELNYYVLFSPYVFMDQFTRGGQTLFNASNFAYNIEKTFINGGSYQATLDLRPFLDQYWPPYVDLQPCGGFTLAGKTYGYYMKRDHNGSTDSCYTDVNIYGLPKTQATTCPPTFNKIVQAGADKCAPPSDAIATACGGSRNYCKWNFDMGAQYGQLINGALGKKYGANTSLPVNNAYSSERRQAGDMAVGRAR